MVKNNILSYVPPYIKDITEMNSIYHAEQYLLNKIYSDMTEILKGNFVELADDKFIRRYEKILDIIPYAQSSLEDRKKRVLMMLNFHAPITLKGLEKNINSIFPDSHCQLIRKEGEYFLTVKAMAMSYINLLMLNDYLRQMLPANMNYSYYLMQKNSANLKIITAVKYSEKILIPAKI